MLDFGAINQRLAELLPPFGCRIQILTSNLLETDLDHIDYPFWDCPNTS